MKGVQRKPDYKARKTPEQIKLEIEQAENDKKLLKFSVEFIARHCFLRFTTTTYLRVCRQYFKCKSDVFFLDELAQCRNIKAINVGYSNIPAFEYKY